MTVADPAGAAAIRHGHRHASSARRLEVTKRRLIGDPPNHGEQDRRLVKGEAAQQPGSIIQRHAPWRCCFVARQRRDRSAMPSLRMERGISRVTPREGGRGCASGALLSSRRDAETCGEPPAKRPEGRAEEHVAEGQWAARYFLPRPTQRLYQIVESLV